MNVVLCCEHYSPSIGGVQKVMRVVAEYFVKNNHKVTVVCSDLEAREYEELNGVKIKGFRVTGNSVTGMSGEVEAYQKFLLNSDFDCLITMAAQQWTCDALLPVLNKISYKKIQIPCGYSGFYQKKYKQYYIDMKSYIHEFDHLIYNAKDYRDINFAKQLSVKNIHHIPVGAGKDEFKKKPQLNIRKKLGIPKGEKVFLTVGSPPFNKGHVEVLSSYSASQLRESSTLILNGDYSTSRKGVKNFLRECVYRLLGRSNKNILDKGNLISKKAGKSVKFTNLNRDEVVSLYFESDIFLFASHIEYSPLVIFECLAAGLPFLTVPVGNLEEIVEWTGGGILCEAKKDKGGFTKANISDMAKKMEELIQDEEMLKRLSDRGRKAWEEKYTWEIMAQKILEIAQSGN